jgi:hypothetical protein
MSGLAHLNRSRTKVVNGSAKARCHEMLAKASTGTACLLVETF